MDESELEQTTLEIWLPKLSRLFGMAAEDFSQCRTEYCAELRTTISARDVIWRILTNLDTGVLSLRERVNVYTSMAIFLREEGENPTSALDQAKFLITTSGGQTIRGGANKIYIIPIDDLHMGDELPIVAIVEKYSSDNYPINFTLATLTGDKTQESFCAQPNQCGVITAFWKIHSDMFPIPSPMALYTSGRMTGYRKRLISEFELLPPITVP